MASAEEQLRHEARGLICSYLLTSVQPARAPVVGSHARPGPSTPLGPPAHPAERWAARLEETAPDQLEGFVAALRAEVDAVRRRALPASSPRPEDLGELVIRADGFSPTEVALALRCTSTYVRRTRVVAGRDAERGRPVVLNGDGRDRLEWAQELVLLGGLSLRAAAAAAGCARSTLHDRVRAA